MAKKTQKTPFLAIGVWEQELFILSRPVPTDSINAANEVLATEAQSGSPDRTLIVKNGQNGEAPEVVADEVLDDDEGERQ